MGSDARRGIADFPAARGGAGRLARAGEATGIRAPAVRIAESPAARSRVDG